MQPPIRVFIVAETAKESRKLSRIFEEAAEFAVAGFTLFTASASPQPGSFDVRVIQTSHPSQLVRLTKASVPTLYLLSEGSPQAKELSGASALLPASVTPAQIRAAAMALAAGLQVALTTNPELGETGTEFDFFEPLTDRELHILNLLADGLSNPQVARLLNISRNTVKFHVSSIISKLGVTSRTEAVTVGIKLGLVVL